MQEGPEFLRTYECSLLVSVNKTANKISGKTWVAAGLRGGHKNVTERSMIRQTSEIKAAEQV